MMKLSKLYCISSQSVIARLLRFAARRDANRRQRACALCRSSSRFLGPRDRAPLVSIVPSPHPLSSTWQYCRALVRGTCHFGARQVQGSRNHTKWIAQATECAERLSTTLVGSYVVQASKFAGCQGRGARARTALNVGFFCILLIHKA